MRKLTVNEIKIFDYPTIEDAKIGQIWINLSNLKAAIFLLPQSLSSGFSAVPNAKWGNTHNSACRGFSQRVWEAQEIEPEYSRAEPSESSTTRFKFIEKARAGCVQYGWWTNLGAGGTPLWWSPWTMPGWGQRVVSTKHLPIHIISEAKEIPSWSRIGLSPEAGNGNTFCSAFIK